MVWGMVWYGMVWGMVWYGMVWGMVWYGMVWGMVWYGMVWGMGYGMVWGMVCMWYYILASAETPGNCTVTCRENFFCDEKTLLCKPLCPEWNLLPSSFVTAYDTFTLVFGPLGMIAGIAVLIVSFIRRKKV